MSTRASGPAIASKPRLLIVGSTTGSSAIETRDGVWQGPGIDPEPSIHVLPSGDAEKGTHNTKAIAIASMREALKG